MVTILTAPNRSRTHHYSKGMVNDSNQLYIAIMYLPPAVIKIKTFSLHFSFSRSGELTGGYDDPNEEYTPPHDSYIQPTGYTSTGSVGYGSEADGKEIVAVKK